MSNSTSTGRNIVMPVYGDPTEHHEWTAATLANWGANLGRRWATEAIVYADRQAQHTIERINRDRQIIEDNRANHRNLNRMLTLLGALFIGLAVTFLLSHPLILAGWGISPVLTKTLAPYSFVITVCLDTTLAAYSFIRKY